MARKKVAPKLPKGIRKRGESYMIDVTVDGVRHTATFKTLAEAEKARNDLRLGASTIPTETTRTKSPATVKPGDTWTLRQAYEKTAEIVWLKPAISQASRYNMADIENFFGADTLVADIKTSQIDDFILWLRNRGLKPGSINGKLSTLSRMLTTAWERDKLPARPRFPKRLKAVGRIRFLTHEEEEATIKTMGDIGGEECAEATIMYLDTGFRLRELFRITPHHIDLDKRTITLWADETKNSKPRTIPLTARAYEIVERKCAATEGQDTALWPFTVTWYQAVWREARAHLGLENDSQYVPHILRHTCCSKLVQRGVPQVHVQRWMGHSNITTTIRYAHLAPDDLYGVAQVLESPEARWRGAGQPTGEIGA